MKHHTLMAAVALALTACGGHSGKAVADDASADSAATPAQTLIARLDSTVKSGHYYYGHHDDTAYGHTWKYVEGNSDVRAVTGNIPVS